MTTSTMPTGGIPRSGDGGDARTRAVRDQLWQAAVDEATAQILERRADRSASAPLATMLLDRARRRRCRAERLRSAVGRSTPVG